MCARVCVASKEQAFTMKDSKWHPPPCHQPHVTDCSFSSSFPRIQIFNCISACCNSSNHWHARCTCCFPHLLFSSLPLSRHTGNVCANVGSQGRSGCLFRWAFLPCPSTNTDRQHLEMCSVTSVFRDDLIKIRVDKKKWPPGAWFPSLTNNHRLKLPRICRTHRWWFEGHCPLLDPLPSVPQWEDLNISAFIQQYV